MNQRFILFSAYFSRGTSDILNFTLNFLNKIINRAPLFLAMPRSTWDTQVPDQGWTCTRCVGSVDF